MDILNRVKDYTGELGALGITAFIVIPAILVVMLIIRIIFICIAKKKNGSFRLPKALNIIIDIFEGVIVVAAIVSIASFVKQEDLALGIRRSCPEMYEGSGITYDDALAYIAKDIKWDAYTSTENTKVVNVYGKFKYSKNNTKFSLQFEYDEAVETFRPRSMKINNEQVNDFVIYGFIVAIFDSCKNDTKKFYDTPQMLYDHVGDNDHSLDTVTDSAMVVGEWVTTSESYSTLYSISDDGIISTYDDLGDGWEPSVEMTYTYDGDIISIEDENGTAANYRVSFDNSKSMKWTSVDLDGIEFEFEKVSSTEKPNNDNSNTKEDTSIKDDDSIEASSQDGLEAKILGVWYDSEFDIIYYFKPDCILESYSINYRGGSDFGIVGTYLYSIVNGKVYIDRDIGIHIEYEATFKNDNEMIFTNITEASITTPFHFKKIENYTLNDNDITINELASNNNSSDDHEVMLLGTWLSTDDESWYLTFYGDMLVDMAGFMLGHYELYDEDKIIISSDYGDERYSVYFIDEYTLRLSSLDDGQDSNYTIYNKSGN